MRNNLEFRIHCCIVDLLTFRQHPDLIWWHTPNGENRSPITGARLKRMGVRRGMADLCFILPDGRGALMEVKAGKAPLNPEQKLLERQCQRLGIPHAVVRSSFEAEAVLSSWGALRERRTARAA